MKALASVCKRRGAARARQGYVTARTATTNRIRGLLAEFGIVLPHIKAMARDCTAAQPARVRRPHRRTRAWRGRCSPRVRRSSCRA